MDSKKVDDFCDSEDDLREEEEDEDEDYVDVIEDYEEEMYLDEDGEELDDSHAQLMEHYFQLIQDHMHGQGQHDKDEEDEEASGGESFDAAQKRNLQESPFAQQIRWDSGLIPSKRPRSAVTMVHQRQLDGPFTSRAQRNLSSRFSLRYGSLFDSYTSQVFCGRYSKDGSMFMSACQDKHIRLYNMQSHKKTKEIVARDVGWSIIDTDYSPDQRWLIYSSWSDYVHLCNIHGEHEIHEALDLKPEAHRFCLFSIKFSPDSTEILGGSSDKSLYIYNLDRREVSLKLEAHKSDINTVCYAEEDNNNTIFSGSDDCLCKVWDRRLLSTKSEPVGVMVGHLEGITHISSKGDGRHFISNSKDQSIKLWDIRRMSNYSENDTKMGGYFDYRFVGESYLGSTQKKIFSGKKVHPKDSSLMTYRGHEVFQTLIRSYFSPMTTTGQQFIYTGSHDGAAYVYDVLTGEVVSKLKCHRGTIRDLSWHPHEPSLVTTSWDGNCWLWSATRGKWKPSKKLKRKHPSSTTAPQ